MYNKDHLSLLGEGVLGNRLYTVPNYQPPRLFTNFKRENGHLQLRDGAVTT